MFHCKCVTQHFAALTDSVLWSCCNILCSNNMHKWDLLPYGVTFRVIIFALHPNNAVISCEPSFWLVPWFELGTGCLCSIPPKRSPTRSQWASNKVTETKRSLCSAVCRFSPVWCSKPVFSLPSSELWILANLPAEGKSLDLTSPFHKGQGEWLQCARVIICLRQSTLKKIPYRVEYSFMGKILNGTSPTPPPRDIPTFLAASSSLSFPWSTLWNFSVAYPAVSSFSLWIRGIQWKNWEYREYRGIHD